MLITYAASNFFISARVLATNTRRLFFRVLIFWNGVCGARGARGGRGRRQMRRAAPSRGRSHARCAARPRRRPPQSAATRHPERTYLRPLRTVLTRDARFSNVVHTDRFHLGPVTYQCCVTYSVSECLSWITAGSCADERGLSRMLRRR